MTASNGARGRGKPRAFDEDELAARIRSIEDLQRIQDAVISIGASSIEARGLGGMLVAKKAGDPTGGVSPRTLTHYRRLLAELPFDPLTPTPPRRRKTSTRARRGQDGRADLRAIAGVAGLAAATIAAHSPPGALRALAAALPPIILDRDAATPETGTEGAIPLDSRRPSPCVAAESPPDALAEAA